MTAFLLLTLNKFFLVGSSLTNEYTEQKLRILIESMHRAITCPSWIRYCPKKNMKRIKLRNKFLKEHIKRNTKLNLQLKNYSILLFKRCKREYYNSLYKKTNKKFWKYAKSFLPEIRYKLFFFPNVVTNLNISKIDKHWPGPI